MFFYIIFTSSLLFFVDSSLIGKVGHEAKSSNATCECAAFRSKTLKDGDEPIISHTTSPPITCPPDDTCKNLCVALAKATAKTVGPIKICDKEENIDNLYVSIFARPCGLEKWDYAELTATEPICCRDKKPTPCETNPADTATAESNKDASAALQEDKKEEPSVAETNREETVATNT